MIRVMKRRVRDGIIEVLHGTVHKTHVQERSFGLTLATITKPQYVRPSTHYSSNTNLFHETLYTVLSCKKKMGKAHIHLMSYTYMMAQ